MTKIFGIVLIFAAAWLMFRLQAGSDDSYDESGSAQEQDNRKNFNMPADPDEKQVHEQDSKDKSRPH